MSAAIATSVLSYLAAEASGSSFREAVNDKYYHLTSPENTALPLALFSLTPATAPVPYYDGTFAERWTLSFSIFSPAETSDAITVLGIDTKLRARLNGVLLTATGYDRIRVRLVQSGFASIVDDVIQVESKYELRGQRTS